MIYNPEVLNATTTMSSIETQLRRLKNETVDEIQHLEKAIVRCETTLGRLRTTKQGYNPKVLLDRNQAELDDLKQRLQQQQAKLDEIESGAYEQTLREELEQNKKMIQNKTEQTKRKKAENKSSVMSGAPVTNPKKSSQPWYNNNNQNNSRDFDYAEKQYLKDCRSIPDHLREKLANMPNHMGYVWRDIWCFGEKPSRNVEEYTLFEKRHNVFLVHVYNRRTREYCLYEKDNANRRKLLEKRAF